MIRIIENFLEINITETTDQIEYNCYLFFFFFSNDSDLKFLSSFLSFSFVYNDK